MRLPEGNIRKLRRSSDDPTAAHALTFSCFRRQPLLKHERTCAWLAEALDRARERHSFDIWAYVFMPDHVHLLIWPRQPAVRLRDVLAAIKLPVSRRAVAFVRTRARAFFPRLLDRQPNGRATYRIWQRGGGYDRDLHEPGTIHATIDYLHANPVRAGLVPRPELWRWSSAITSWERRHRRCGRMRIRFHRRRAIGGSGVVADERGLPRTHASRSACLR